jgi:hypothetical protein
MRFPSACSLGLCALLAVSCGEGSPADPAGQGHDGGGSAGTLGVLLGDVHFIGVPCPLIYPPRPPCDGPYPDYEVIVLHADGTTDAARTRSDSVGVYRVALPAGEYVILTPRGIDPSIRRRNEARVVAGDTTRLDLVVDTGIR